MLGKMSREESVLEGFKEAVRLSKHRYDQLQKKKKNCYRALFAKQEHRLFSRITNSTYNT